MQFVQKVKNRFSVRPLQDAYPKISRWFESPLGRRLLKNERRIISDELRYLFGYHLMQLSSVRSANMYRASRINHCFTLAPQCYEQDAAEENPEGVVDYNQLPLEDESVDVTILHHVLEFSAHPHQVLKEAARVTMPRGYVIIVAFNPYSFSGLVQPFGALMGLDGIYRRQILRPGRVGDWLEFLDFSCLNTRQVFHNFPINNSRYLKSSKFVERLTKNSSMPGMSFVMVARKDKAGIKPIRPSWDKVTILGGLPMTKQAIRSRAARSAVVLPFDTGLRASLKHRLKDTR